MVPAVTVTLGDIFGFVAVFLAGTSAFLMAVRGRILRAIRNLTAVRISHVVVSSLAGIFMVLHIGYYFALPYNTGIILGYAAFSTSLAVWLTGTAFLEKVRDSLLFHGSFSIVLVALALMHAASATTNIPFLYSELMIASGSLILIVNMSYQVMKMGIFKSGSSKKKVVSEATKKVG